MMKLYFDLIFGKFEQTYQFIKMILIPQSSKNPLRNVIDKISFLSQKFKKKLKKIKKKYPV